jgi:hypothetical protein
MTQDGISGLDLKQADPDADSDADAGSAPAPGMAGQNNHYSDMYKTASEHGHQESKPRAGNHGARGKATPIMAMHLQCNAVSCQVQSSPH